MMDLNLQNKRNKEIVKLITEDEGDHIDEEIEFKVFSLAKNLKKNQIINPVKPRRGTDVKSQTEPVNQSSISKKTIKINFNQNRNTYSDFSLEVDTELSMEELVKQIEERRVVRIISIFVLYIFAYQRLCLVCPIRHADHSRVS